MPKVKFLKKPGYYNGIYPEGSIVMVDDNFAAYAVGLGDAELAPADAPITDPTPYMMKPRVSNAEESLSIIADALRPRPIDAKEAR